MNFQQLVALGQQILGLTNQAAQQFDHLKSNLEASKAALSTDEQAELAAMLNRIHAANQKLSAELDTNLQALEARG